MTWTTPLMTVNDRVVMCRFELAVSHLNPSLVFHNGFAIMAFDWIFQTI